MNKRKIPTFISKSIYAIPASFYISKGYRIILTDLDNTLANYKEKTPSEITLSKIKELIGAGLEVYIVSNNTEKRVKRFADACGVGYAHKLGKPFSRGMNKFIRKHNFDKNKMVLVGEQVYTDVICANKVGIDVILTEPISELDAPWTRFNRLREQKIRKKIIADNLTERID